MRDLTHLNSRRLRLPIYENDGDHGNGAFGIVWPFDPPDDLGHEGYLLCIASNGGGWDHVSVSWKTPGGDRTPRWVHMSLVHRLFFKEGEAALQLHVPPQDHINYHEHTLHLWRPRRGKPIPRPPGWMVGPQGDRDA